MPAVYDKMGIRFQYPDNWVIDEEDALSGQNSVSVYSQEGAFWTVVLHAPTTDPRSLTTAALEAMRQEYEDFDAEPAVETIAGHDVSGFDLNFFCLDLTNTAWIRGFRTPTATCMVLCQAEDREFARVGPVFRAITTSLITGK